MRSVMPSCCDCSAAPTTTRAYADTTAAPLAWSCWSELGAIAERAESGEAVQVIGRADICIVPHGHGIAELHFVAISLSSMLYCRALRYRRLCRRECCIGLSSILITVDEWLTALRLHPLLQSRTPREQLKLTRDKTEYLLYVARVPGPVWAAGAAVGKHTLTVGGRISNAYSVRVHDSPIQLQPAELVSVRCSCLSKVLVDGKLVGAGYNSAHSYGAETFTISLDLNGTVSPNAGRCT